MKIVFDNKDVKKILLEYVSETYFDANTIEFYTGYNNVTSVTVSYEPKEENDSNQ